MDMEQQETQILRHSLPHPRKPHYLQALDPSVQRTSILQLSTSSSNIATYQNFVASLTSPSLSNPTSTLTLTPFEFSSYPAEQSIQKPLAVRTGVGVPVAVLLLFALFFLFLSERERRIHAQKMADDAQRQWERGRKKASKTARDYELLDHPLPKELEYVPHCLKKRDSRAVYEANGDL